MANRRFLIPIGLVGALFVLGCSGFMGGSGDGSGDDTVESPKDGKKGDIRVAKSRAEKKKRRDKRPTNAQRVKKEKKNEFIVKLAPGVRKIDLKGGKPRTGNKAVDRAFDELSLSGANQVYGGKPKNQRAADSHGLGRTIHIRTNKPKEEVIAKLEAHDGVEWVEAVVEMESAGIPNDPYWEHQWHMQNLNLPTAWEVSQGKGVVVAVVDTGVSVNEDGFHKLLKGKDFVDNDDDASDQNGHGTHVAGTIAQATNNGVGVAGVAPMASILPVRVLDANGSGSNTGVANGIIWAVDHGANIINLSLGSPTNSDVVADACAYAYDSGVLVVAATGNDGFTDYIGYPAALDTTLAVGSVDATNEVAFYSNQGKEIDLVAPGGDTTADKSGDGMQDGVLQETMMGGSWAYQFLQGTSMATPHVAGVAALVYANGVHDPDQLRQVLTSSATDLGDKGWDSTYGHGFVNPVAALKAKPKRGGEGGKKRGGKLKITKSRVKNKSAHRVVIGWMTNQPASTLIKGNNGFKRKDDAPTKIHRVTVSGKPGQTVTYTIGSMKGDHKAKREVEVTF